VQRDGKLAKEAEEGKRRGRWKAVEREREREREAGAGWEWRWRRGGRGGVFGKNCCHGKRKDDAQDAFQGDHTWALKTRKKQHCPKQFVQPPIPTHPKVFFIFLFFQCCDVAQVVVIHNFISPYLAIFKKNGISDRIIYIYIYFTKW
jgi:hypothetical protein